MTIILSDVSLRRLWHGSAETETGPFAGRDKKDNALVVETTHMVSPTIVNDLGHPLSRNAVLTERYCKQPGETTLRLELQIDDPASYTDTLSFSRIWEPSETEQVEP